MFFRKNKVAIVDAVFDVKGCFLYCIKLLRMQEILMIDNCDYKRCIKWQL